MLILWLAVVFVVDGVQVEPMMKKETSPHNQVLRCYLYLPIWIFAMCKKIQINVKNMFSLILCQNTGLLILNS